MIGPVSCMTFLEMAEHMFAFHRQGDLAVGAYQGMFRVKDVQACLLKPWERGHNGVFAPHLLCSKSVLRSVRVARRTLVDLDAHPNDTLDQKRWLYKIE
jgi:hypothetical protein